MIEQAIQGFLSIFSLDTLPLIFVGIPAGLIFGLLPGLAGVTALALLIPFIYGMEPHQALAFLLAAHAVVYTGGSVTAVLLNIPGSTPNAATLIDGYPMTQQGMAGRALGNGLAASALGGIVGAFALIFLIFAVRPIVMAFGLPEYFFLIFLGLSFIAVIGSESPVKGIIAGIMGIFISFFGLQALTGEPRFCFGSLWILDGFRIVPVGLGIFAIPEAITLLTRKGSIAQVDRAVVEVGLIWEGIKDIFRHFRLFIQSSFIGSFIGIIPGVGGDVAPFVAYGVAKKTSKNPDKFGHGAIEGVIAPEASNNAKEGGSLLPTLAFGIPGSAGMALLMGAFLIVGIEPGPLFLKEHADIAFSLASTIMFANIIGALIMMLLARQLSGVSFVRGSILGPIVLILVVAGSFCSRQDMLDVVFTFVFGGLGYAMKVCKFNRPALFLGYILGPMAERYYSLSEMIYCVSSFFLRPISGGIILVIVLVLFWDQIRSIFNRRKDEKKVVI